MTTQHTSPVLTTAIAYLDAREHESHVIWHDHVVGHLVYASREDVERFGQMLDRGTRDAYSIWCSDAVIGDWICPARVEVEHLGSGATGADLEPYAEALVDALREAGVDVEYAIEHNVDDEPCAVRITAHCDRDTYQPIAERVLTEGWSC